MINKNTFAFRLNSYVISIMIITGVMIFSTIYFVARGVILDSVKENAKLIAERNVNEINAVISKAEKIPLNISSIIENSTMNEEELKKLLINIVNKNKEIFGAAIAFEPYSFYEDRYYFAPYVYKDDDRLKIFNLNNDSYAYFYQDWYQIPKHLLKPLWSEPYFDEGGGNKLMTTYSVPFYKFVEGEKKLWGIITVDVDLDWLTDIVSNIKIFDSGFAFVLSGNGTIVTHPNKKYIMNQSIFSLAEETKNDKMRLIGRSMIRGESNFESLRSISLGEDTKVFYTPFVSNNWSLGVIFPENELYADLNKFTWIISLISFLSLLFVISAITFVSRSLTKPLASFSSAAKEIGSGKFNTSLPDINTKDEISELHDSFFKMQEELNHYVEDLKKTTSEKEKIESELRIAHQIQMGMVPKIFPPFPDRDDIDLYAFLEPAKEVGGDLYDFFFIEDDKLVLAVGDVAGKGVPASLFMAVTRTLIRSKMIKGADLAEVVGSINKDLIDENSKKLFVTLIICVADLNKKEIQLVNAGHNYPYIQKKNGEIKQIKDSHGMALGIIDMKPYESGIIKLESGDKIIFYSDGVNEAMNNNSELFGYERFENSLALTADYSSEKSIKQLLDNIKKFTKEAEASDDITVLMMKMN